MNKRKLVTVRMVSDVQPIPGADAIECITVEGWKLVSGKGNYKPGDWCVYFEIDSFLPDGDARWQDLVDKSSRVFEGKKGHVLRTIKLRGQVSQGFSIPLGKFPEIQKAIDAVTATIPSDYPPSAVFQNIRQMDFADLLGVVKYEPPIPAELVGQVKGAFPSFIKKTDQERIQNLPEVAADLEAEYEVSLKLDGTSMTAYVLDGEVGVCSRNLELKINEENKDNTMVKTAVMSGLLEAMVKLGTGFAVQGELMGPGIQGNRENLKEHRFYVFDIFDIDEQRYLAPVERLSLFARLHILTGHKLHHVPVLHTQFKIGDLANPTIDGLLEFVEGPSLTHPIREGLVFKRLDGKDSFKVISNKFLIKAKD